MTDITNTTKAVQADDPHTIPILVSASSVPLRKRFFKKDNGSIAKKDYALARNFTIFNRSATSIRELSALLTELEQASNHCIVRGAYHGDTNPKKVRRLKKLFSDKPRHFLCVDVDELPCPDFIDPISDPPEDIIDHIISHLPEEFHDASYHYQFSSSHGTEAILGDGEPYKTLKAHIWFMLDKPKTCKELKLWAKHTNDAVGFRIVDESLYSTVQIHYVTKPKFDDGIADPVKNRSSFVERGQDTVAIKIPKNKQRNKAAKAKEKAASNSSLPGFENKVSRIGPDGFNNPIYRAMCSYIKTCLLRGEEPDRAWLKNKLQVHISSADKGTRSEEDINRYMSDEYLDDQIDRVCDQLEKDSEKSKEKAEPTYPDKSIPLEEARAKSMRFVDDFFWKTIPKWHLDRKAYENDYEYWQRLKKDAEKNGEALYVREPLKPNPPYDVLAPDVGVGKTFAAISHIARHIFRKRYLDKEPVQPIVILAPTIQLAEELKSEASRQGIKSIGIMRGRLQENPKVTGEKMCKDKERIKAVEGFAGNARDHACGTGAAGYSCPFYTECEYQKQRKSLQSKDVIIMAHNYLFGPPPIKNFKPEFIVIDEDITKSAIPERNFRNAAQDERDIRLDALTQKRPVPSTQKRDGKKDTEFLMDCSYRLHRALQDCPEAELTRQALDRYKLTAQDCQVAMKIEQRRIQEPKDVFPKLDTKTLVEKSKAADNMRPYYILTSMWDLLATFLNDPNQTICATVRRVGNKTLRILKKREIHECYHVPTLLLDATFSPEVFKSIFYEPNRYLAAEAQKPHQYVRQIVDTNVATSSFTRDGCPEPITYDIYRHIQVASRLFAGKGRGSRDVLVVLPLQIESLLEMEKFFPPLPQNVALAHFNAIRGKNAWEDVANIIVISRSLPQVRDIEEKAETARQSVIDRLKPNDDGNYFFQRIDKALRLKSGRAQTVSGQWYHPDTVAEGLRWSVLEAELIQSIGRARGVNRTEDNPLVVDIITNTTLPVMVHETMTMSQLVPDRFDLMAMNGAIPSSGKDQYAAYPGLYNTPKAAERAWERLKGKTPNLTIDSYIIAKWGELIARDANPPLTHMVRYRNKGARGQSKTFLYNQALYPNPLRWLQKHVSLDIILDSEPEPLPWQVAQLPWGKNQISPPMVKDSNSHLLPMPDLNKIKRKQRTKHKETTFTLEEIGCAFDKNKADIQDLLKKHKNDEQAIVVQLLKEAVLVEGRVAYARLPEIVQKGLDDGLLNRLST